MPLTRFATGKIREIWNELAGAKDDISLVSRKSRAGRSGRRGKEGRDFRGATWYQFYTLRRWKKRRRNGQRPSSSSPHHPKFPRRLLNKSIKSTCIIAPDPHQPAPPTNRRNNICLFFASGFSTLQSQPFSVIISDLFLPSSYPFLPDPSTSCYQPLLFSSTLYFSFNSRCFPLQYRHLLQFPERLISCP